MQGRWTLSLPRREIAALAILRQTPGIELCEAEPLVWLRGDRTDEKLDQRLRKIPGARRFATLDDGQLQPRGSRVPAGYLPAGPWVPLVGWLTPELPLAIWPGEPSERTQVTLVRGAAAQLGEAQEPALLLTSLGTWVAYGRTAPQVRLDRLTFAADRQGRVIVRGTPLPPLRGERFLEWQGVAIPVGWDCFPAVDAQSIRAMLQRECPQMQTDDLALLFSDGSWERVPAASFVRTTRVAIRLSAEGSGEYV